MFLDLNIGLKGYEPLQGRQSTPAAIHVQLEAASRRPGCGPHCRGTKILGKGRYQRRVGHLDCVKQAPPFILLQLTVR